jgi:hypothetical protein
MIFKIIIQRAVCNDSCYPMENTLIITLISNMSKKKTFSSPFCLNYLSLSFCRMKKIFDLSFKCVQISRLPIHNKHALNATYLLWNQFPEYCQISEEEEVRGYFYKNLCFIFLTKPQY